MILDLPEDKARLIVRALEATSDPPAFTFDDDEIAECAEIARMIEELT